MYDKLFHGIVFFALASAVFPECRADHLWIIPEPVGFDARVHVCINHEWQPDRLQRLSKAQLWRISDVKACKPVEVAIDEKSLIAKGLTDDPGSTYAMSYDCGVSFTDGEPNRVYLHAKSHTSADLSTWRTLCDAKRFPLEIVSTRDRNRFKFSVSFNGKSLAYPVVTVRGPDAFVREVQGDAQGQFSCELPQSGMYGICTTFVDSRPGDLGGQAFIETRHLSTLTLPIEVIPSRK